MNVNEIQKVTLTSPQEKVELKCMKGHGIFTVYIEDADYPSTGAAASFTVAANMRNSNVVKTCSVTGIDGESLNISWSAGDRPRLSFSGNVNPEYLPKRYLAYAGSLSTEVVARK